MMKSIYETAGAISLAVSPLLHAFIYSHLQKKRDGPVNFLFGHKQTFVYF